MSDDPIVDGLPLSSMRVVDLKEALKKRDLSQLGNKSVLADRLREHVNNEVSGVEGNKADKSPVKEKSASPAKAGLSSPPADNPLVAAYLAKQRAALEASRADAEKVRGKMDDDEPAATESAEEKETASPSPAKRGRPRKNTDSSPTKEASSPAKSPVATPIKEVVPENKATAKEASPAKEPSPVKEASPKEVSPAPAPSTRVESRASGGSDKPEKQKEKSSSPVPVQEEPVKEKSRSPQSKEKSLEKTESPDESEKSDENETKELTSSSHEKKEEKSGSSVTVSSKKTPVTAPAPSPKAKEENGSKSVVDAIDMDVGEELDYDEHDDDDKKDEVMVVAESEKKVNGIKESNRDRDNDKSVRRVSPSRHPASSFIHIRGLVRPYTVPQLKSAIQSSDSTIQEGKFWIDNLRSQCICQVGSEEEAERVRVAMHGTTWPAGNLKTISVHFSTQEAFDRHSSGADVAGVAATPAKRGSAAAALAAAATDARSERRTTLATAPGRNNLRVTVEAAVRDNAVRRTISTDHDDRRRERDGDKDGERKRKRSETPPFSRGAEVAEKRERGDRTPPVVVRKTPEELFKKTKTQPAIFYMPLDEKQAEEHQAAKAAAAREKEERRKESARDRR